MKPKIKVLLIAYNFPPYIRASSLRTFSWFQEFSDQIDLTVITRHWDDKIEYNHENYFNEDQSSTECIESISELKRIYRIPNRHNFYFKIKNLSIFKKIKINRVFTLFELLIKWFPITYFDNERSLYNKAKELFQKEKFDVVLTSGEPFILFKYIYMLKNNFNVKTIIDYRDGFSSNAARGMDKSFIQKLLLKNDRKFELKIIKSTDKILFVSDQLKKEVSEISSLVLSKSEVINNGIDSKLISSEFDERAKEYIDLSFFNITFVGTMYPGHNINWVGDAYRNLDSNVQIKIRFNFIGTLTNCPDFVRKELTQLKNDFPDNFVFYNYLENSICRSIQNLSNLLLKFNAFEQKEGHFGKKMYEYAMSKRKVLSINKDASFINYLNFFDDKPFTYFCNSSDEIVFYIKEFYGKYLNGENLTNEISEEELLEYSTIYQTRKIENLIFELKNNLI